MAFSLILIILHNLIHQTLYNHSSLTLMIKHVHFFSLRINNFFQRDLGLRPYEELLSFQYHVLAKEIKIIIQAYPLLMNCTHLDFFWLIFLRQRDSFYQLRLDLLALQNIIFAVLNFTVLKR